MRTGRLDLTRPELPVDELVTTYPFTEINAAIADVIEGKVVKPVLVW